MLVTLLVILALGLASAENYTGKCKKMNKKITTMTKKFGKKCAVAIDGGWSDYSKWGACSAGCGKGTQTRSKTCNNPPPASGGKDCGGEAVESKECMNIAECSAICGWGGGYQCDKKTACSWSCSGGKCWRGCNGAECPHPDAGFCSDCMTWCWISASGSVADTATCSSDDDCIGVLANPCVGGKGCA